MFPLLRIGNDRLPNLGCDQPNLRLHGRRRQHYRRSYPVQLDGLRCRRVRFREGRQRRDGRDSFGSSLTKNSSTAPTSPRRSTTWPPRVRATRCRSTRRRCPSPRPWIRPRLPWATISISSITGGALFQLGPNVKSSQQGPPGHPEREHGLAGRYNGLLYELGASPRRIRRFGLFNLINTWQDLLLAGQITALGNEITDNQSQITLMQNQRLNAEQNLPVQRVLQHDPRHQQAAKRIVDNRPDRAIGFERQLVGQRRPGIHSHQ